MRFLLIAILFVACMSACTAGTKSNNSVEKTDSVCTYENHLFSMQYPKNWQIEEEVNNMCDTIPAFSQGFRVTLLSPDDNQHWQSLSIQKSALFDCHLSAEGYRDLSIYLKQFEEQYIRTVDSYIIDSLQFGMHQAAMAGFVVVPEPGDTVIHKQMIVKVGTVVYYLNNVFHWKDDGIMEKRGDSILSTVRFMYDETDV